MEAEGSQCRHLRISVYLSDVHCRRMKSQHPIGITLVWFEPTDIHKASKPFTCDHWNDAIVYSSPNVQELRVMYDAIYGSKLAPKVPSESNTSIGELIEECVELSRPLIKHIPIIVVTLGKHGSILVSRYPRNELFQSFKRSKCVTAMKKLNEVYAVHYPAPNPSNIVSVSGAGDCFASGMIAAIIRGSAQDNSIRAGQEAAILSLSSHQAVPSSITENSVFTTKNIGFPEPTIIDVINQDLPKRKIS